MARPEGAALLDDRVTDPSPRRRRSPRRSNENDVVDPGRNIAFEDMPQEQQHSALKGAALHLLSGADRILAPLDLLRSSVADVVGLATTDGGWEKYNPFDQWLTPFDSRTNRVEGRELLRDMGVLQEGGEDTWGNFAVGIGSEILMDPITYGAGSLIRQGIKGGIGVADNALTAASKSSIRAISKPAGKLRTGVDTTSAVAHGLFDARAKGAFTESGQRAGRKVHELDKKIDVAASSATRGLRQRFLDAGLDLADSDTYNEYLKIMEDPRTKPIDIGDEVAITGKSGPTGIVESIEPGPDGRMHAFLNGGADIVPIEDLHAKKWDDWENAITGRHAPAKDIYKEIKADLKRTIAERQERGFKTTELMDDLGYHPRQAAPLSNTIRNAIHGLFGTKSDRLLDMKNPHDEARLGFLKIGEEGTALLREITSDPDMVGVFRKERRSKAGAPSIEDVINQHFIPKYGDRVYKEALGAAGMTAEDAEKNVKKIVKWVGNLDPEYVAKGGFFGPDPLAHLDSYNRHHQRLMGNFDIVADELGSALQKQFANGSGGPVVDGVPIKDLFGRLDMDSSKAVEFLLKSNGILDNVAQSDVANLVKQYGDFEIDPNYARDILRIISPLSSPKSRDIVMRTAHNVTDIIKRSLTGHFPSFHVRNSLGAHVQNMAFGFYGKVFAPKEAVSANLNVYKMLNGESISKASEWPIFKGSGLDDRQATNAAIEVLLDHGIISSRNVSDVNTSAQKARDLHGILNGLTPDNPKWITGMASKQGRERNWQALRNYVGRWGENAGDTVEAYNRIAPFLSMLKREAKPIDGVSLRESLDTFATEASEKINLAQVDYGDLTPYEQEYARLIFPFYSFAKGITKGVATELWEHPAGGLAQMIRIQSRGTQQDESAISEGMVVPDYMRRGGSITLDTDSEGNLRALTGLGLMHEQPIETAGSPGAQILGMLNPIPKFLAEASFGRSFFFDEPLNQLDPTLGRIGSNISELATGQKTPYPDPVLGFNFEHAVASSPLSRYLSTARQITDPRKFEPVNVKLGPVSVPVPAIIPNLLTGVKISDVNPKRRLFSTRDVVNQVLEDNGARTAEYTYIPKEKETSDYQNALLALKRRLQRMSNE